MVRAQTGCCVRRGRVHTTLPSRQRLCANSGSSSCHRDKKSGSNFNALRCLFSEASPSCDCFLNTRDCWDLVQAILRFFSPLLSTGRGRVDLESCFLLWQGCVLWALTSVLGMCQVGGKPEVCFFCLRPSATLSLERGVALGMAVCVLPRNPRWESPLLQSCLAFCCFSGFSPEDSLR